MALTTDGKGNLNVNIAGGSSGGNDAAGPTGSPVPADADYIGFNVGGDLVGVSSSNPLPVTGGGGGTQYTDETAESAGAFTITVAGLYDGTDVVGLRGDPSNNLYVNLHTAIPAGSALIGQVEISDGTNILGTPTHPIRIDPTGTTVQPVLDSSTGATGSSVPADASYTGFNSGGNLVGVSSAFPLPVTFAGTSTVTVAGTVGAVATITGTPTVEVAGILGTSTVTVTGIVTVAATGTQTVTVAGTVTAACTGTQTVTVVGTSTVEVAGIVGTSTVTVAGTVGVAASITGTATVEVAGILGTSTVEVAGIVGTSTVTVAGAVDIGATTAGGATPKGYHISSNAVQAIKSSAGQLYGYFLDNSANTATTYFQFFNITSGSVSLGSSASLFVIPVPANSAANLSMTEGWAFGTAMSFAATTTYNGSTAPSSAVDCTIAYD